jgi:hypothetical protein
MDGILREEIRGRGFEGGDLKPAVLGICLLLLLG